MTNEKPVVTPAGKEVTEETNKETPETSSKESDETSVIDTTSYEAKIQALNVDIASKDSTIAELNAQILAQKAANYDLLTQVRNDSEPEPELNDPTVQDETLDIEDLFSYDEK